MRILVVGAGAAGCAAAGRLAERGHSVVLVDAGPGWISETCPDVIRFPPEDAFAWRRREVSLDQDYLYPGVEVQRFAGGPQVEYVRGWGMGGSASVNGLIAIRPTPEDFALWTAAGCEGWGWEDVLPVLKRMEHDPEFADEPYHGVGGPIPIHRIDVAGWGSGDELLARAATGSGHAWEPDYHRPGALGLSRVAANTVGRARITSYDGYVDAPRAAGLIDVVANTTVRRLLLQGATATGVEAVDTAGRPRRIEADLVVLAAGTFQTIAILQRSGIGPAELTTELGIPNAAELPVGRGIHDHVGFWLQTPAVAPKPAANGARGNAVLRASSGLEHSGPGDFAIFAANPPSGNSGMEALLFALGYTVSEGSVRLDPKHPEGLPQVRLNLLSDERDLALARHALRAGIELLASEDRAAHDRAGGPLSATASDAELNAWLSAFATDTLHATGGCAMGPGDGTSVVDATLRVHGVSGLYVADLSVCPSEPRANTYLTAVMLGERAADFIGAA